MLKESLDIIMDHENRYVGESDVRVEIQSRGTRDVLYVHVNGLTRLRVLTETGVHVKVEDNREQS
jgi:hypothetical protein